MPVSAEPVILLPSTVPLKVRVSGIGLVIATFHETSFPFSVPSAMSVVSPSACCVPVSVLPAVERVSVLRRSPMGVCIVKFQVPSADMARSFRGIWDFTIASGGATKHLSMSHQRSSLHRNDPVLLDREREPSVFERDRLLAEHFAPPAFQGRDVRVIAGSDLLEVVDGRDHL